VTRITTFNSLTILSAQLKTSSFLLPHLQAIRSRLTTTNQQFMDKKWYKLAHLHGNSIKKATMIGSLTFLQRYWQWLLKSWMWKILEVLIFFFTLDTCRMNSWDGIKVFLLLFMLQLQPFWLKVKSSKIRISSKLLTLLSQLTTKSKENLN
jgi:hypothetical protein